MRVVEKTTQLIPGKVEWREECKDHPYERTVPYTETENVPVTKTKKDCQPYRNQTCHEYFIPTFDVVDIDKSQDIQLDIEECIVNNCTYLIDFELNCLFSSSTSWKK